MIKTHKSRAGNGVLQTVLSRTPGLPISRTNAFVRKPVSTQVSLLKGLVSKAKSTEFGLANSFDKIGGASDIVAAYQESVPFNTYDDLCGYIGMSRAGEPDMTWPGQTQSFALSSGTASAGKLIPATSDMIRAMRRAAIDALATYVTASGRYDIFRGKLLSISGTTEKTDPESSVSIGEMSGIISAQAPWLISHFWQAVPVQLLAHDAWDTKLRSIASITKNADVRVMAMVPSWAPVLFEKLLVDTEAQTVSEVWPNLSTFFSSGVPLSSYRALLERYIGGEVNFVELYTASEGFFAFQDRLDSSDMLLHLNSGVFYEFVKLSELGSEFATRYTIADVEIGERYAMFVTTCAGLWSYEMRDVIRFTSTCPHRIVVAGRTTDMLDNYGEAVFADEVQEAIEATCATHNAHFANYHVAPSRPPDATEIPQHRWLIEFVQPPPQLEQFSATLDQQLRAINHHYDIRREAGAFLGAEVVALGRGTFDKWLNGARKRVGAQTKVPRVRPDCCIAGQLLALNDLR